MLPFVFRQESQEHSQCMTTLEENTNFDLTILRGVLDNGRRYGGNSVQNKSLQGRTGKMLNLIAKFLIQFGFKNNLISVIQDTRMCQWSIIR